MPGGARPRLIACTLLGLALLSAGTLYAQQGNLGTICGEVRMARGDFPPSRLKVTIRTRGIMVDTIYTDDSGRFCFLNLPGNPYIINLQEEAYRPIEERVILNPQVQANQFVFLNLEPLEPKPDQARPGVQGANPWVVNVAAFLDRYPKEVRKEYERGLKAEASGKAEEAIQHYRRVVQMAPDFYFARNNLGSLLVARQEFQVAEEQFRAVIRLNQSDAAGYLNLGNVYLLTGRLDEAREATEEGLRKQPDHAFGRFVLGSVYSRMGRLSDAERELRESLRLNPGQSRPHLEMVNVYMRQNRKGEAISELKTFIQVFPNDSMVPQAKEVLARLEETPVKPPSDISHP